MTKGSEQAREAALRLECQALKEALTAAHLPSPALLTPPKVSSPSFDERGGWVHLQVVSPLGSLGSLEEVLIAHDGQNSSDGWFCSDVLIKSCQLVSLVTLVMLCLALL
jgi:hypothetical protein